MARRSLVTLAALAVAAFASAGRAQDAPRPDPAKAPEPPRAERSDRTVSATLRVQVVLTRFQGEKKVASLPYTLLVSAGGMRARMRMGVDTPIPTTSFVASEKDGAKPSTSFQYRNVGTNLDCGARDLGDGRYLLMLTVENSSALAGSGGVEGAPLFRRFEASLDPVLRDGQSVQAIASTDPVTGEVVRIDVTLNVVK